MSAAPHPADQAYRNALAGLAGGSSANDAMAAVRMVDQAVADGHPDATALTAVFYALGAMRAQNWGQAFDTLQLAAERGSNSARRQLRLLAGARAEDSRDWAQLRAGIDIPALLRARQSVSISDKIFARTIDSFASPEECAWVIERVRPSLKPAAVWDDGGARVDGSRSNSAFPIAVADTDLVIEVLRARISQAVATPVALFEPPQILHYSVGQEFTPHFDFLDPQHASQSAALAQWGQRMGTFLIYLNGDFEGGETEFPRAELSYRGSTGDALMFGNLRDGQPDPLTLHAGRPPTSGEKWVMSTWIRSYPPGAAR